MAEPDADLVQVTQRELTALTEDRRALRAMLDILRPLVTALEARPMPDIWLGEKVRPNPGGGGVSPIDHDQELAAFIRPLLGQEKLTRIADLCRARFGPDRAPSKSAIHRYWHRLNHPQQLPMRTSKAV